MNDSLQSRLERLEILYSEQDYTVQTLNNTITQQDREIASLTIAIERLRVQLQSLRAEVAGDIDPAFEQPPHY